MTEKKSLWSNGFDRRLIETPNVGLVNDGCPLRTALFEDADSVLMAKGETDVVEAFQ